MRLRIYIVVLICEIYSWRGVSAWTLPSKAVWVPKATPSTRLAVLHSSPRSNGATTNDVDDSEGSVLGASLLFGGTAIGAGMLALPAETAPAGFVPTVSSLLACWAFTLVTSLVTLEASWTSEQMKKMKNGEEGGGSGGGFLSITKQALGPAGEVITGLLFWFLLTSIVVAYTSEAGQLLSQASDELLNDAVVLPPAIGSVLFMVFFASLEVFGGVSGVDAVNRLLVTGLLGAFVGLVAVSLPGVSMDNLSRADWSTVYPGIISIGILSFGAQNVVPTLLDYLGGDPRRTRQAILFGSLVPLLMYSIWEGVFLGVVPGDMNGGGDKMEVVTALGKVGGALVKDLVEVFSACAIGSSMAGVSVSLVDFVQDGIDTLERSEPAPVTNSSSATPKRLFAAAIALGPPLGVACIYPDAFLGALENAGLIGGVSLYGILPSLAVLSLRRQGAGNDDPESKRMPGRLWGGPWALYMLVVLSAGLIIPDLVVLGKKLPFIATS